MRYSENTVSRYTLVLDSASIGVSAFMPNPPLFLAFITLVAIPHALTFASLPALVSKSVSAEKQGVALGINGSLVALANGLGPIVMGVGSRIWGVHMPFVTAALFIVSAWFVLHFPMRYVSQSGFNADRLQTAHLS